jgi:hypothetical protein
VDVKDDVDVAVYVGDSDVVDVADDVCVEVLVVVEEDVPGRTTVRGLQDEYSSSCSWGKER